MTAHAPRLDQEPSHREDPRYLRGLLGDARAELVDADRALVLLAYALGYVLAKQCNVPHDVVAERRVLGALLLGRAHLRDVAGVRLVDVAPELRRGAAYLLALLELEAAPGEHRAAVRRIPRRGVERREHLVDLVELVDVEAADALAVLPWPGATPSEELRVVRDAARRRRALEVRQ